MANRFDVLLNGNDLVIQDNDIVLAESDNQHIADTINACPGWWKESFTDGVGIVRYLKAQNVQQELSRSIRLNLQADGYNSNPIISFDKSGTLIIDTNVSIS